MAKRAFHKITAGLEDAIAYVEGDTSRVRIATPLDVKTIRTTTKKSQTESAKG